MDLGCNDGILTEKDIRENAGGMMDLCRKTDIPIVLASEALSLECVPEPLWSFNVLRFLADERHLMQIDLYESLNRRIDTGCLFWDQVHPTSYGHRLIADELYPKIVAQLCALVEKQRYESETPIQKVQK